jgi:hypothetical protein
VENPDLLDQLVIFTQDYLFIYWPTLLLKDCPETRVKPVAIARPVVASKKWWGHQSRSWTLRTTNPAHRLHNAGDIDEK